MDLYSILQTLDNISEGSMKSAEQHKTGPKFTSYWKGTDAGTPGEKMVGAMEDTTGAVLGGIAGAAITKSPAGASIGAQIGSGIEDSLDEDTLDEELRAAWDEYLAEFGANNPGSTGTQTGNQSQANTAKDLQTAQQNINKLKSAGVNLPTGVSQASQSTVKAVNEPTAIPSAQDRKLSQTLGSEFEQLLAKGKPSDVSQLANAIRQVKQGAK